MSDGQTPLSKLVREKLAELHVKQTEFCKLTGFDQGLLSKVQNSVVTTLSLESALKLAVGLKVKPKTMLELIGRPELNELVLKAYGGDLPCSSKSEGGPKKEENLSMAGRGSLVPART
jgi:transcriptional regulator with XRE-family HTH domain